MGKFLSHQLGSCQGLHINAACGTSAGQRTERRKTRGTLNVTIETLRTLATIYQASLSFDTHAWILPLDSNWQLCLCHVACDPHDFYSSLLFKDFKVSSTVSSKC